MSLSFLLSHSAAAAVAYGAIVAADEEPLAKRRHVPFSLPTALRRRAAAPLPPPVVVTATDVTLPCRRYLSAGNRKLETMTREQESRY
jgi:hypothetical protein